MLETDVGNEIGETVKQVSGAALARVIDKTANAINAKNENSFETFIVCCNSGITGLYKYFGLTEPILRNIY